MAYGEYVYFPPSSLFCTNYCFLILKFALYLCNKVFGPGDAVEFVQNQLKVFSVIQSLYM